MGVAGVEEGKAGGDCPLDIGKSFVVGGEFGGRLCCCQAGCECRVLIISETPISTRPN